MSSQIDEESVAFEDWWGTRDTAGCQVYALPEGESHWAPSDDVDLRPVQIVTVRVDALIDDATREHLAVLLREEVDRETALSGAGVVALSKMLIRATGKWRGEGRPIKSAYCYGAFVRTDVDYVVEDLETLALAARNRMYNLTRPIEEIARDALARIKSSAPLTATEKVFTAKLLRQATAGRIDSATFTLDAVEIIDRIVDKLDPTELEVEE